MNRWLVIGLIFDFVLALGGVSRTPQAAAADPPAVSYREVTLDTPDLYRYISSTGPVDQAAPRVWLWQNGHLILSYNRSRLPSSANLERAELMLYSSDNLLTQPLPPSVAKITPFRARPSQFNLGLYPLVTNRLVANELTWQQAANQTPFTRFGGDFDRTLGSRLTAKQVNPFRLADQPQPRQNLTTRYKLEITEQYRQALTQNRDLKLWLGEAAECGATNCQLDCSAGLTCQNFLTLVNPLFPQLHYQPVLRLRYAETNRPLTACKGQNLVVVIDRSLEAKQLNSIKAQLKTLLPQTLQLEPNLRIGLVSYANTGESLVSLSNQPESLVAALDKLRASPGSGNQLGSGLVTALTELTRQTRPETTNYVLAIGDGLDSYPGWSLAIADHLKAGRLPVNPIRLPDLLPNASNELFGLSTPVGLATLALSSGQDLPGIMVEAASAMPGWSAQSTDAASLTNFWQSWIKQISCQIPPEPIVNCQLAWLLPPTQSFTGQGTQKLNLTLRYLTPRESSVRLSATASSKLNLSWSGKPDPLIVKLPATSVLASQTLTLELTSRVPASEITAADLRLQLSAVALGQSCQSSAEYEFKLDQSPSSSPSPQLSPQPSPVSSPSVSPSTSPSTSPSLTPQNDYDLELLVEPRLRQAKAGTNQDRLWLTLINLAPGRDLSNQWLNLRVTLPAELQKVTLTNPQANLRLQTGSTGSTLLWRLRPESLPAGGTLAVALDYSFELPLISQALPWSATVRLESDQLASLDRQQSNNSLAGEYLYQIWQVKQSSSLTGELLASDRTVSTSITVTNYSPTAATLSLLAKPELADCLALVPIPNCNNFASPDSLLTSQSWRQGEATLKLGQFNSLTVAAGQSANLTTEYRLGTLNFDSERYLCQRLETDQLSLPPISSLCWLLTPVGYDLAMSKLFASGGTSAQVAAGESIDYQVTTTNLGQKASPNYQLIDQLIDSQGQPLNDLRWQSVGENQPATTSWQAERASLAPQAKRQELVRLIVPCDYKLPTLSDGRNLRNRVGLTGLVQDLQPENNLAEQAGLTIIGGQSNLQATIELDTPQLEPNQNLKLLLKLSNQDQLLRPVTAGLHQITIALTLEAGLELGPLANQNLTISGQTLTLTLPELPAKGEQLIAIPVKVKAEASDIRATLSAETPRITSTLVGCGQAKASLFRSVVSQVAHLGLTKTLPSLSEADSQIEAVITLSNPQSQARVAQNIFELTDPIDSKYFELISSSCERLSFTTAGEGAVIDSNCEAAGLASSQKLGQRFQASLKTIPANTALRFRLLLQVKALKEPVCPVAAANRASLSDLTLRLEAVAVTDIYSGSCLKGNIHTQVESANSAGLLINNNQTILDQNSILSSTGQIDCQAALGCDRLILRRDRYDLTQSTGLSYTRVLERFQSELARLITGAPRLTGSTLTRRLALTQDGLSTDCQKQDRPEGQIWQHSGDLTLDTTSDLTIYCRGTLIIIGGDLKITGNGQLRYADALASLGVMLLPDSAGRGGNLIVDDSVAGLVGSYFLPGQNQARQEYSTSGRLELRGPGASRLVAKAVFVARQITLLRQSFALINDGRSARPDLAPPGFAYGLSLGLVDDRQ